MIHVVVDDYHCFDWHDWEESAEMLKNEAGSIDLSGEDLDRLIFNDVFREMKKNRELALKDFKDKGSIKIFLDDDMVPVYPIHAPVFHFSMALSKDKDGNYTARLDSQLSAEIHYTLYDTEKEKIKYLPIREYISFPKKAPLVARCFCEAFDTYEEAAEYKMPDGFRWKERGCLKEKDAILPFKEEDLEGKWYASQMEVLKYQDRENFEENFHPFIELNKFAMEADSACETQSCKKRCQKF